MEAVVLVGVKTNGLYFLISGPDGRLTLPSGVILLSHPRTRDLSDTSASVEEVQGAIKHTRHFRRDLRGAVVDILDKIGSDVVGDYRNIVRHVDHRLTDGCLVCQVTLYKRPAMVLRKMCEDSTAGMQLVSAEEIKAGRTTKGVPIHPRARLILQNP